MPPSQLSVVALGLLALAAPVSAAHRPYSTLGRIPTRPLPSGEASRAQLASLRPVAARGDGAPYCAPGQPCWPTAAQWSALNKTTGGALVAVAPPLASCFGDFPGVPQNQALCDADIANYSSSFFRASLVGATQAPNWEQDPVSGDDCFDGAKPCTLGNIPPYAVKISSAAQVAAALAFARTHNIRVVVKSTGHEYQGRSSGKDSLLVWLHNLRGISTLAAFAACAGDAPRAAIRSAPGDAWGSVYAAAKAFGPGYTVVGGSEISVSSVGGYTLGAGHSWQGPFFGMAADNVLEFTAVLANGTAVSASRCLNPDLFWAVRGGGGSSFAVVTSATYALHPYQPAGVAGLELEVSLLRGEQSTAVFLDAWLYCSAKLWATAAAFGVVAAGYWTATPGASGTSPAVFSGVFVFNGTVDQANAALGPIAQFAEANPQDIKIVGAQVTPYPSLIAWHESFEAPTGEATGSPVTLGSRLIPTATMLDDTQRIAVAINLTEITAYGVAVEGLMVAGGEVAAAPPDVVDGSSIGPAWRAAGLHVVIGAGWPLNATLATQAAVTTGVSELTQILRTQLPDSGAYWSESDFLEPDWQDAFWGDKYARLQAIKKDVDPLGVFQCHHCVELPA